MQTQFQSRSQCRFSNHVQQSLHIVWSQSIVATISHIRWFSSESCGSVSRPHQRGSVHLIYMFRPCPASTLYSGCLLSLCPSLVHHKRHIVPARSCDTFITLIKPSAFAGQIKTTSSSIGGAASSQSEHLERHGPEPKKISTASAERQPLNADC